MLQQSEPDDYVIATGESHSVSEFLDEAASCYGLNWREFVETDPRYLRPTEVDFLLGDPSKARQKLGWTPRISFRQLVRKMVAHDLDQAQQARMLADAGHSTVPLRAAHG